jgi:hypothetical protein
VVRQVVKKGWQIFCCDWELIRFLDSDWEWVDRQARWIRQTGFWLDFGLKNGK